MRGSRRVSQVCDGGIVKRHKVNGNFSRNDTLASDALSQQLEALRPFDHNLEAAEEWDMDNDSFMAARIQNQTVSSLSMRHRALITPRSSIVDLQSVVGSASSLPAI